MFRPKAGLLLEGRVLSVQAASLRCTVLDAFEVDVMKNSQVRTNISTIKNRDAPDTSTYFARYPNGQISGFFESWILDIWPDIRLFS